MKEGGSDEIPGTKRKLISPPRKLEQMLIKGVETPIEKLKWP